MSLQAWQTFSVFGRKFLFDLDLFINYFEERCARKIEHKHLVLAELQISPKITAWRIRTLCIHLFLNVDNHKYICKSYIQIYKKSGKKSNITLVVLPFQTLFLHLQKTTRSLCKSYKDGCIARCGHLSFPYCVLSDSVFLQKGLLVIITVSSPFVKATPHSSVSLIFDWVGAIS